MRVQPTQLHRSHSAPVLPDIKGTNKADLFEQPVFEKSGQERLGKKSSADESFIKLEKAISSFEALVQQKKDMHKTADVIVTCLSPILTPKRALDESVWMLLLRILGKIRSEKRDLDFENQQLGRLKKDSKEHELMASSSQKQKLAEITDRIEKANTGIQTEFKELSDEESVAVSTVASVLRGQHDTIMATLSEIRA